MAKYDVSNPKYSNQLRMLEKSDPGHANIFNPMFQQLLENDEVLKCSIGKYLGDMNEDPPELAEGLGTKNIIDAINKVFTLGSENKQKLVDNLIAMGIQASTDDTWGTLLDKVLDMTDTSNDTVTAATLLAGYTAHNASGDPITGTMPNNGAWTANTTGNGNVPIPAGHHNGQGYVSGAGAYAKGMVDADARTNTNSANYKNGYNAGVAATKKGTAGTGDVLAGKTFTNAGSVGASGTMANKGNTTQDAAVTQDATYTYLTVPANGYYNTASKLRSANSNLKKTLSCNGSTGKHDLPTRNDMSQTCGYNISADKKSVNIYVNGYECPSYSWTITVD